SETPGDFPARGKRPGACGGGPEAPRPRRAAWNDPARLPRVSRGRSGRGPGSHRGGPGAGERGTLEAGNRGGRSSAQDLDRGALRGSGALFGERVENPRKMGRTKPIESSTACPFQLPKERMDAR